jgi:hypothetical protein
MREKGHGEQAGGESETKPAGERDEGPTGYRRRGVLAAFAAAGLAGCREFGLGSGTDTGGRVSPAPVPTVDENRRETPTPTPGPSPCPELPSNAEVYVCSPAADDDNAFELVPERRRYTGDTVRFRFRNRTEFSFRTGRDWWTLSARGREWGIVAQGDGADRTVIAPGEEFVWRVGGSGAGGVTTAVVPAPEGAGRHALAVTGYVAGGELTAVIAPFVVE